MPNVRDELIQVKVVYYPNVLNETASVSTSAYDSIRDTTLYLLNMQ
ncbi:MAG: hypothetical protein ACSLEN_06900 [Candidatus Malihini olakiniferum]